MRQVLLVQRRLPEYRLPLFERLKAILSGEGVRLVLAHGDATSRERTRNDEGTLPWAVRVRNRYATVRGVQVVVQEIPRALRAGSALVILSHENGILSNYPILVRRMLAPSTRVAFWGHGPKPSQHLRQGVKRWTARQVDWWFAYTSLSVDRVLRAGFPADRVTCLDNSIDTQALQGWARSITEGERTALRRELGIDGGQVAVYLGSLTPEKKLPFLVQASELLRRRNPDFHLLVVGDGPLLPEMREAARSRPWLHVVGARHDREKALHCSLARVNLNPGMVGLGIVDSFALGIPLATTELDIHSPEIAYLEPGRNGLLTPHDPEAFAAAAGRVLEDDGFWAELVAGCHTAAGRYDIDGMASRFASGILAALEVPPRRSGTSGAPAVTPRTTDRGSPATARPPALRLAVVWRHFLPYHSARLLHLRSECERRNIALLPIEVASRDSAYRIPPGMPELVSHCCFPGSDYQSHSAREIHRTVKDALSRAQPDVVFAPATPFPEGMAAIEYRNRTGARVFIVDEAWSGTDRRGPFVHAVKRLIHRSVDGAFVPAPLHDPHFVSLGIPGDRIVHGMAAVDNAWYAEAARAARARSTEARSALGLPPRYFLFVGRFLPRKGLDVLFDAFTTVRRELDGLGLVLAGGSERELPRGVTLPEGVLTLGARTQEELGLLYGLAKALVVPSHSDPWGLVVNEGMASGLSVIVSRGCGASALVQDGVNGWVFEPGDAGALAQLLRRVGGLSTDELERMGARAQETIAAWGLERFTEGVMRALEIPRALPPRGLAAAASRLWRGWVRMY